MEKKLLRISVLSFRGLAPATPISQDFDEQGGSIGREVSNTLALPDPDKHLSRVQAFVRYEGGSFFLQDQGSNPSLIGNVPVGRGNVAPLQDGARLTMAEFVLGAEVIVQAPSSQDIGGLLGIPGDFSPPDEGLMASSFPKPEAPYRAPEPPPAAMVRASDDPFAVFAVRPKPAEAPLPPSSPVDDPFAAFGTPAPAPLSSAMPGPKVDDPLGLGLSNPVMAPAESVDNLFGLQEATSNELFLNSPLGVRHGEPLGVQSQDPLAMLAGSEEKTPEPIAMTARNDGAILQDAFFPPRPVAEPAVPSFEMGPEVGNKPLPQEKQTPSQAEGPFAQDVFDELLVEGESEEASSTSSEPGAVKDDPLAAFQGASPASAKDFLGLEPALSEPVPPEPAPVKAAPAPTNRGGFSPEGSQVQNQDALREAFIRGLGQVESSLPKEMTPEFMEQIGMVLRESVRGTVELLAARAMTKREIRADVTMVVSKNNNPLKFSPDVNFALKQLLSSHPTGGFMSATEAMRDAYNDLRAHQIGFMAGMRAALMGVLARFKPQELEAKLSAKSFFDSVMPSGRKAKLWDAYEQHFAEISREVEDDFQSLFGRAFLKAYEEQIDKLENAKN